MALVISDGITARVGSLMANKERFMPWNTIKNEDDRPLLEYQLEKVVRGFFDPELFLDYMRYFVLFEDDGDSLIKKNRRLPSVPRSPRSGPRHHDRAVRERRATYGDEVQPGSRKAGVFWHTQGSGKSISMCCYAGKLLQQPAMKNPTLVVVTELVQMAEDLTTRMKAAYDICVGSDGFKDIFEQAENLKKHQG